MKYIPKLQSVLLSGAVLFGFSIFFIAPGFAGNSPAGPHTFRLIFSNNMAGDYKPCG